jgi:murein DD-endopeptidase MepM/ murein hydrolase activator NlpD
MNVLEVDALEDRLQAYGTTLDEAPRTSPALATPSRSRPHRTRMAVRVALLFAFGSAVVVGFAQREGRSEELIVAAEPVQTTLSNGPTSKFTADWVFPVRGSAMYEDTFGAPRMTGTEFEQPHQGVDLFVSRGTQAVAIREGEVYSIGTAHLGGRQVWLRDNTGGCYYYANLESFADGLSQGQQVSAGEPLGTVGKFGAEETEAGNSAAVPPHLHLEIHPGCAGPINPTDILRRIETLTVKQELATVGGIMVHRSVARPLTLLLAAATEAGFRFTGGGYRSSRGQIEVRTRNCGPSAEQVFLIPASRCKPPTAKPGLSAHEQGRAIDFVIDGRAVKAGSPAHRWLVANAPGFGFTAKAEEPWHWEFRS